ncbi:hypothetical protein [Pseudomonas fulva]|uniref:hypothetical protein n=1 Tax=Pseudomonas fulva TaxID=47880 RepID=UPI0015E2FBCF|nr:hypothetical protein [Pseudomonas fulva]MBA1218163.1 hypothetical protein [Pseudomonas fulva]
MSAKSPLAPIKSGDPSESHLVLSHLSRLLGAYLYRYGSEAQLHESLAKVLGDAGYQFTQEHILDPRNRADFLVEGGIVIEVKVDGALSEALRQVDRYINLDQVKGVILASTQRWADNPLVDRPAWQGKAFGMVRLGRQSL